MNRPLRLGILVIATLAAAGLAAPALTSVGWLPSPIDIDLEGILSPPASRHWLGTDELGRDVLSRLVYGSRTAVLVAFVASLVALALGVPAGALAGLRGGWWDQVLARLMEVTSSLPALPLILLIVSMTLGSGPGDGTLPAVLLAAAIGAVRWATIARYVRAGIWKARVEEHALAAVALGAGRIRLLAGHLIPAAVAPALVSAAFGAGSAVLIEATLSYLGLGTQSPAPSWGKMVSGAAAEPGAWWLLCVPGGAIALLVFGFNLLAEGIRIHLAAPDHRRREENSPDAVRAESISR